MKVVILKEQDYLDLKVSVISALYHLNELPTSPAKSKLKQYLLEASKILEREDGETDEHTD